MRYIIFEDSLSAHCCFGYSIVDTQQGDDTDCKFHKGLNIAEFFEEEEAVKICKLLNAIEHGKALYCIYDDYEWVADDKSHFAGKEWKLKETNE